MNSKNTQIKAQFVCNNDKKYIYRKKHFPHVMIFYRWLELIKVHARPQTKLTKALIWKYDYHHYATHSLSPDRHKGLPWHSSQLNWLIVGAGASGIRRGFGVSFT